MKKMVFRIMIIMLVLPALAWAGPFVTADIYPPGDVTHFEVTSNGTPSQITYTELGGNAILMDLAGIDVGSYTITAKACNLWGCSDATVPFDFTKILPSVPTGMQLRP